MKSTNLLETGEVSPYRRLAVNEHFWGSSAALYSSAADEVHGVVEDGTVGKRRALSRESPAEAEPVFMTHNGSKEPGRGAVRAPIVVRKRGNARGAKGSRKMEAQ
jgi:hypothetical protein